MTEKQLFRLVAAFLLFIGEIVFFRNIVWTTFFSRSDMALIGAVSFFVAQIVATYYIIKLFLKKDTNETQ